MSLQIRKFQQRIRQLSTGQFFVLLFVFQVLLHAPFLDLPPVGQHTWRQVDAASSARNYFEEGSSFFYPTSDLRVERDDQGEIYKEFPLLYWVTGQSYRLTGFHNYNLRTVQLLASLFVLFAAFRFAKAMKLSEVDARWFTFFFWSAPYSFYYSITMLPNFVALGCFLFGFSLIRPGISQGKPSVNYLWGSLFIALAVLFKATWLFYGLPLAYLYFREFRKKPNLSVLLMALGTGCLVIGLFSIQYLHSLSLYEVAPWERAHETFLSTKEFPRDWGRVKAILNQAIGTWFFGFYVNFASLPIWLFGAWMAFKEKRPFTQDGFFWVLWISSFLIYGSLFFVSFGPDGGYYLTSILPLVAYITTFGLMKLREKSKFQLVTFVFICLIPLTMVFRVQGRWTVNLQVPDELLNHAEEITALLPEKKQVLVLGDDGVIIFLYYLHVKGVAYSHTVSMSELQRYKKLGFKSLVLFEPMGTVDGLHSELTFTGKVGRFHVYKINEE